MAAANPSTLEKLAVLTGKVGVMIPIIGGTMVEVSVGLEALAAFLDSSGADLTQLDATHAEYLRREALAKDPAS